MGLCQAVECLRPTRAMGLCSIHYYRARRGGSMLALKFCGNPNCQKDITALRGNRRYCDRHCQNSAALVRAGRAPLEGRRRVDPNAALIRLIEAELARR